MGNIISKNSPQRGCVIIDVCCLSGGLPADNIKVKKRVTNGNSQHPNAILCKINAVLAINEEHGSTHPAFHCTVM